MVNPAMATTSDPGHLSPASATRPHVFGAHVIRTDTDERMTDEAAPLHPLEQRYDDADHPGEDITTQHPHSPEDHAWKPFSPVSEMTAATSFRTQGDYGLLTPQMDSDNASLISNAKKYDHHESRKFLMKIGFGRFFVTLIFCTLITVSLKAFEGFNEPYIISSLGNRVFNALMLGLSLGLGLNLASSLKRYAVILRWSLLTRRYVSLEVFDLILGLETLTKVMKLMVISFPGTMKVRNARTWPWKRMKNWPWFRDARDDGTRFTWIVCLLWLSINIGAQVLVAALSLFWPVDPSQSSPLLRHGDVTISDLSNWYINPVRDISNRSAMAAANTYGTEAGAYDWYSVNETITNQTVSRTPIYKGDKYWEYRFVNRNPKHVYSSYYVTKRKVQSRATCTQLRTRGDIYDTDPGLWVEGSLDSGETYGWYKLPEYVRGSISWIGATQAHCGSRCTNFTVYQTADNNTITNPSLFLCNSTLSQIINDDRNLFGKIREEDKVHIYGTDDFARIATGAIAWTGYVMNGWYSRQTQLYLQGSRWSPTHIVSKDEVEDMISRFTISAIAAFDDHGIRYTVPDQNTLPTQGQQLTVDWGWILGLLGAICVIQFGALIALIAFANKSIIRDESFFSIAMLLTPVTTKIGKEGMNMSGEEIKKHKNLQWRRIRYDYREGDTQKGEPNKVDIFWQGRDMPEQRRSWASGAYYT